MATMKKIIDQNLKTEFFKFIILYKKKYKQIKKLKL